MKADSASGENVWKTEAIALSPEIPPFTFVRKTEKPECIRYPVIKKAGKQSGFPFLIWKDAIAKSQFRKAESMNSWIRLLPMDEEYDSYGKTLGKCFSPLLFPNGKVFPPSSNPWKPCRRNTAMILLLNKRG